MLKVVSTEIKKILSKAGIYILSIFLAIILVLGVFIYQPQNINEEFLVLGNSSNTFTEKYAMFTDSNSVNTLSKKYADNLIENAKNQISHYSINFNSQELNYKMYFEKLINKLDDSVKDYRDSYTQQIENITFAKTQVITSANKLKTEYENAKILSTSGSYVLLVTNNDDKKLKNDLDDLILYADGLSVEQNKVINATKEFTNKILPRLNDDFSKVIFPILKKEFVNNYTTTNLDTKYSTLLERLDEISTQIESYKSTALINENNSNFGLAPQMDILANKYLEIAKNYSTLIDLELKNNALNNVKLTQENDLINLNKVSKYDNKSLLIRQNYLFENNAFDGDYAKPLTIGINSNATANMYDYTYFVLKLFSFVLIVFAVALACRTIAGEIKDGTMRYLAIRPVSRTKIYFGKLISILLLSLILLIFSAVVALLVGGAVYGWESLKILSVFNAEFAFTIKPIYMIIILMLDTILKISFFVSFAMLLSIVTKSDIGSLVGLLLFFIINLFLPIFFQGANSWLMFYFFSHISIYNLFGSSMYAPQNNLFNLIIGAKCYDTSNIILTIICIVLVWFICNFIAVRCFKKREL